MTSPLFRQPSTIVYFNKIAWDNLDNTDYFYDFTENGQTGLVHDISVRDEFYAFYDFFMILSTITSGHNYPMLDHNWSIMIEISCYEEDDMSKPDHVFRIEIEKINDYQYEEKVWDITDDDNRELIENDNHNNPLASKIDQHVVDYIKQLRNYTWDKTILRDEDAKQGYKEFYTRTHLNQYKIARDSYTSELHNALELLTAYKQGSAIKDFIASRYSFQVTVDSGRQMMIDEYDDIDIVNFFYMYGDLRNYRVLGRSSLTCVIDVPNPSHYRYVILGNIKLKDEKCKSQFIIVTRK